MLQQKAQFSLKELNNFSPIKKGVSEVIVYLKLAQNMSNTYIDKF